MFCSPDSLSYFQTRIPHSSRQSDSPSAIDFFGGLPFDDDSLDRFAPSFATTCTSCSASRAICCCLPLSRTPQDSSRDIRSDALNHTEELEIQHAGTTSAFSNRDLAPGTLTSKRFDHQSRLSFFSTSSFVVAPKSPRLEPMFGDETEVDSSSQFQLNLKHTGQDSLAGVVLHFNKITSGKKAQLSDFTEELFDIRSPEAQPTAASFETPWPLLLTNPDFDDMLTPTDDGHHPVNPATTQNFSGRSKISKLQHEVLNTWFYSHLESPWVTTCLAANSAAHNLHRYPSEQEKTQLCKASKLNEKQVMNWFVNNRKRVWQPMKREQAKRNGIGIWMNALQIYYVYQETYRYFWIVNAMGCSQSWWVLLTIYTKP